MSTKAEKPVLQGQRIKTRKRDEKAKYDPVGFRDSVLQGLNEAGSADLDAVYKYLDTAGNKLNYRGYGETLFDILIAGGILAPGGTIMDEAEPGKPFSTEVCVFRCNSDMESLAKFAQVFTKLMRRYKYLEKIFGEEMKKVLMFLRGFPEDDRTKLARIMTLWISEGLLSPNILTSLLQEHLIKDMVAVSFLVEIFVTWLKSKDLSSLKNMLKKAGIDAKLMNFFPQSKQTDSYFAEYFNERGLGDIVSFQKQQESKGAQKELQTKLTEMLHNEEPVKEIINNLRDSRMADHEVVSFIWPALMSIVDWNKKEELMEEQALRHIRQYAPLLAAYCESAKAELTLICRIQDYCYDNMNLMKSFSKIIILLYKTDVLSEDVIFKWYKEAHLPKGKSVFLEQMKRFVEWLQHAEEESEEEED